MEWAFRIYTDPARLSPRYAKNALFLLGSIARELVGTRPAPPWRRDGPPRPEAPATGPETAGRST